MNRLSIKTRKKREVLDITDVVEQHLGKNGSGSGVCHVLGMHHTAALTTADLDPGTDLDMLDAFEAMIPKLRYRHPHNPAHVGDHIISALIGTSVTLPFERKKLLLGTWQRVVLIELDGPRERDIVPQHMSRRLISAFSPQGQSVATRQGAEVVLVALSQHQKFCLHSPVASSPATLVCR